MARRSDNSDYREFLRVWRETQCEIVFSLFHLLELRRHPDDDVRRARYELVCDLAPLRLDISWPAATHEGPKTLIEREILRTFNSKGMTKAEGSEAESLLEKWTSIFPGRIAAVGAAELEQVFDGGVFGWAADVAFSALRSSASAQARPLGTEYKSPKLGQIPNESAGIAEYQHMLAFAEEATSGQESMWNELRHLMPDEAITALRFASAVMMRDAIALQARVGARRALTESLGIEESTESLKLPLASLTFDWSFRNSVDSLVRRLFPIKDREEHSRAVSVIQLSDCPGSWLRNAVELELRRSTEAPVPADQYDLDHLAHLPYVDLLTADKRTVDFCLRVLQREDCLESVRAARPPLRASEIAELGEAIAPLRD